LSKDKKTNLPLISWPVHGYAYDVLIGGLYPDTKTEWDYGMRGLTFEVAVPVTQGNELLKRVRELFGESAAEGKAVTSTYRRYVSIPLESRSLLLWPRLGNILSFSGINIKVRTLATYSLQLMDWDLVRKAFR